VNIILFEEHERGKPLPRRDPRAVHLVKVLRKKQGDTFEAGLIDGDKGQGLIEGFRFDGALQYSLRLTESAPPRYPLRMAVGFVRPIQLRRILRDLSAIGTAAIDLVNTELGEKSYRETKLLSGGGARAALIEGAAQARDTRLPALACYDSVEAWLAERPWEKGLGLKEGAYGWNLYAAGVRAAPRSPLLVAADNVRPVGSFALLGALGQAVVAAVGSERGWSDNERAALDEAGFERLSLGPRPLRTETACTAAAVLALEKMGAL
jgi:RsmE family RNA methyltransferase